MMMMAMTMMLAMMLLGGDIKYEAHDDENYDADDADDADDDDADDDGVGG